MFTRPVVANHLVASRLVRLVAAVGLFVSIEPAFGIAGDATVSAEVYFDMPLVAAAVSPSCPPPAEHPSDLQLVDVEFRLSSMIVAPQPKRIDQWIVRCQPRGSEMQIANYAPRTEVASAIQGPIQIKSSDETSQTVGLSVDGTYGHLAHGNAGMDRSSKTTDSLQYDRIAPVQAVVASGTINRGRGVYFKLKWTEQQVLEGEKTFRLTLAVPASWRSGLVDIAVIAQSEQKSFGGWDEEILTLGRAAFVVAVVKQGDEVAMEAAVKLARSEELLRRAAAPGQRPTNAITGLVRNVAGLFDSNREQLAGSWVEEILVEGKSPHADKQLLKLPVETRVVALDYCQAREDFLALNHREFAADDEAVAKTDRYRAARASMP